MKRTATALWLAILPVLAGAGGEDVDLSPAALTLSAKGAVAIVDAATPGVASARRQLASHCTVYVDQELVLSRGAQVTLLFWSDGHVEQVRASGTFKVGRNGCQPRVGVQQIKVSATNRAVVEKCRSDFRRQFAAVVARVPDAGEGPSGTGGPSIDRRSVIRPIFDSTVLAAKPTFAWPATHPAKKYTLSVYFLEKRIWSVETDATSLEYAGETPLKPDEMYSWRVTTPGDEGRMITLCGGVFRTASERQQATAAALQKSLARPEPPLLTLAAVWYKQNGLIDEAIAVDERLAKLAPDAGTYRELEELYFWAGRREEARAAARLAVELENTRESGTP